MLPGVSFLQFTMGLGVRSVLMAGGAVCLVLWGSGLYLKVSLYLVRLDTLDPHIAGEGIGAKERLCILCVSTRNLDPLKGV